MAFTVAGDKCQGHMRRFRAISARIAALYDPLLRYSPGFQVAQVPVAWRRRKIVSSIELCRAGDRSYAVRSFQHPALARSAGADSRPFESITVSGRFVGPNTNAGQCRCRSLRVRTNPILQEAKVARRSNPDAGPHAGNTLDKRGFVRAHPLVSRYEFRGLASQPSHSTASCRPHRKSVKPDAANHLLVREREAQVR